MIDLLTLIQQDVTLTQKGKDWWGLCVFHREQTPSFSVSPASQLYYCFGCGAGGDAISWLRRYRKLSYQEACRVVGKELLPPVSRRVRQAEAETLANYYQWEHAQHVYWTERHRTLLADKREAEIACHAIRRRPELYTEEEKEAWTWWLVEVNLALEESALVPTMADIFTYDSHREERFLMWENERGEGA